MAHATNGAVLFRTNLVALNNDNPHDDMQGPRTGTRTSGQHPDLVADRSRVGGQSAGVAATADL